MKSASNSNVKHFLPITVSSKDCTKLDTFFQGEVKTW